MTQPTSNYAELMHERGFRNTLQRQFILDALSQGKGHTTAEEIVGRVQAKAAAVNRATVYRTLDFLCQQRLVVAANIGGQTVYEIAGKEPHHHLVCLNCGGQEPLEHSTVKPFFAKIKREYGFEVETNHLALFGLCRQCRAADH
jgi:Fur family ferric uptake transcriptional regulator